MKRYAAVLLASVIGFVFTGESKADPIIELGLAIDVSGSISTSNFNLQKNAYINVLTDPTIVPQNGTVAIGIVAFDNAIHPVYTTTIITTATIGALKTALMSNLIDYGGSTAIGDAINYLSSQLLTNDITSSKQVIDVSTDGDGNTGVNQVTAANNAITAGIDQVNCLGIGSGANCNFVRGSGAFSETVASFADFETSLQKKIGREITVPEPSSMAILGIGLFGLYGARRYWKA